MTNPFTIQGFGIIFGIIFDIIFDIILHYTVPVKNKGTQLYTCCAQLYFYKGCTESGVWYSMAPHKVGGVHVRWHCSQCNYRTALNTVVAGWARSTRLLSSWSRQVGQQFFFALLICCGFWIRDLGSEIRKNKDPGSGTNIPDPSHCPGGQLITDPAGSELEF